MPDKLIEQVAEAIYMTHCKPPAPVWDKARDDIRQYVRHQARSAIETVARCRGQEDVAEHVARAIYQTHAKSPHWINASASVRRFVRAQAQSAIKVVDQYRSGTAAATRVTRRESS